MRLSSIFEQDPATASGAASVSRTMGSGASGVSVARALGKAEKGEALNPTLLKALAPYADTLDKILSTPAFRNKFTQLVKQVQMVDKKNQELAAQQGAVTEDQDSIDAVAGAITRRIMMQHTDLLSKFGPVKVMAAIDDVADFAGSDGLDEIGSSDVSIWTKQVIRDLEAGHFDHMESVDEALNVKQIKKDLNSGMSVDAVIGKHANKNTSNTDEIRKIIKQHAWNNRMKKENVKEDLQADDGEYYDNADDFFGKFEADSFDREEESKDGMEVRGYIDDVNVMVFRYDSPEKTSGYGNYNDSGLNEAEEDSVDTVTMDIPLLLRMMEYAREDAQEDMDLHDVAERMIELSKDGPLSMDDYDSIVSGAEEVDEVSNKTLSAYTDKAAKERDAYHADRNKDAESARKYHNRKAGVRKALSITKEDEQLDELSPQTLGSYVSKSVKDEKERRAHGIRVRDELRKATGKNFGTPLDRKLYSPTASRAAGQKRAIDKLTGKSKVPATEGYYTPGPETMPGAVGPQEDTNVSFNQTKRMGDASVTVSANAKDMDELHRVLKLAGIEVKGAPDAEPSVADAAVALAPHMPEAPAEEPCGCSDEAPAVEVKPLDFKYSTDKTALVNVLRDKLKRL